MTTTRGDQVAHQAARSAPFQLVARIGLVAYAAVNLLVAWLVVQVAIGNGGKADKNGAFYAIAEGSAGGFLLWVVTVGLGAVALWHAYEVFWGHRRVRGTRKTVRRVVSGGEAVLFGYLAYKAGTIAGQGKSGAENADQRELVGGILLEPYGTFVVSLAGIAVLIVAALVVHRGLTKRFTEDLDLGRASLPVRTTVTRLGQIGYTALGVAYGTAGVLLVVAAINHDSSKATGLDAALKTLAQQSYGQALLLVIGVGFAAFGAYTLFDARYRRTG